MIEIRMKFLTHSGCSSPWLDDVPFTPWHSLRSWPLRHPSVLSFSPSRLDSVRVLKLELSAVLGHGVIRVNAHRGVPVVLRCHLIRCRNRKRQQKQGTVPASKCLTHHSLCSRVDFKISDVDQRWCCCYYFFLSASEFFSQWKWSILTWEWRTRWVPSRAFFLVPKSKSSVNLVIFSRFVFLYPRFAWSAE